MHTGQVIRLLRMRYEYCTRQQAKMIALGVATLPVIPSPDQHALDIYRGGVPSDCSMGVFVLMVLAYSTDGGALLVRFPVRPAIDPGKACHRPAQNTIGSQ